MVNFGRGGTLLLDSIHIATCEPYYYVVAWCISNCMHACMLTSQTATSDARQYPTCMSRLLLVHVMLPEQYLNADANQTDGTGQSSRCTMLFTMGCGLIGHRTWPSLLSETQSLVVLLWPMMLPGKLTVNLCCLPASMQSAKSRPATA